MKVIGISGLPGSGKNLISTKASEKGFIVVHMGDCVREESLKRNEDSRVTAVKLREEYGKYVVANLTIQKIKELTRNIDDLSNKVKEENDAIYNSVKKATVVLDSACFVVINNE